MSRVQLFMSLVACIGPLLSGGVGAQSLDANDILGIARGLIILDQTQRQGQPLPQDTQQSQVNRTPADSSVRAGLRELQANLNALGYDAGSVDGVMGRRTSAAVAQFEADNGYPVDGQPDQNVVRAIALAVESGWRREPAAVVPSYGTETLSQDRQSPYPAPASPITESSSFTLRSGVVFIGDRVAVAATNLDLQAPRPLAGNLGAAIEAVVRPEIDYSRLSDEAALMQLGRLGLDERKQIAEIGLRRPLTILDVQELERLETQPDTVIVSSLSDPFVARRAAEEIRRRLARAVPGDALERPLPLRVFCQAQIAGYDFERGAFPLQTRCEPAVSHPGRWLQNLGVTFAGGALPEQSSFPEWLPMAPDQAERFQSEAWQVLLVSFETDLSVESRRTEAGLVVTLAAAPGRNHVVHAGKSPTDIAFAITAPQEAAPAVAANPVWDGGNSQHIGDLAARAPTAEPLPPDGISFPTGQTEPIGQVQFSDYDTIRKDGAPPFANPYPVLSRFAGSPGSWFEQIAVALRVTPDRLLAVAWPQVLPGAEEVGGVFLLLPEPASGYGVPIPADLYGRWGLGVIVSLDVLDVRKFRLHATAPVVIVAAAPREARLLEPEQDGAVIERFDLRRDLPADPAAPVVALEIPTRAWLLSAIAQGFGVDPSPLIANQILHPDGLSTIEQRARLEALLAASAVAPDAPAPDYWLFGTAYVGDYDFDTGRFPLLDPKVALPETLTDPDLAPRAINTQIRNLEILALAVPREEVDSFERSLPSDRMLPLRLRMRPILAEASTYGDLFVQANIVGAEILMPGALPALNQPEQILMRIDPGAVAAPAERRRSSGEALALIQAALGEREEPIVVRRRGTDKVGRVLVHWIEPINYQIVYQPQAPTLPPPQYGDPVAFGEILRADPTAALVTVPDGLFDDRKTDTLSAMGKIVLALAQEQDIDILAFPPEANLAPKPGGTPFEELVASGADQIVIRRRGESGPAARAFAVDPGVYTWAADAWRQAELARELGHPFQPELPQEWQNGDLAAQVAAFRETPNSVLVLSAQDLRNSFEMISDLDLTGRAFPPAEIQIGIARDHPQTAADFQLLGLTVGMDRAAAAEALKASLKAEVAGEDPVRIVGGGAGCAEFVRPEAAGTADVGRRCLVAEIADGKVTDIAMRQVIEGNAEETVTEALKERFSHSPFTAESRSLPVGGRLVALGWGRILATSRDELGRIGLNIPPAAAEAVIWIVDGVTTVYVRLDSEPPGTAPSAAVIDF